MKVKKVNLKDFNDSVTMLHDDIAAAVNRYFGRGFINPAIIIGLLEEQKFKVMDYAKGLSIAKSQKKEKADYIG